MPRYRVRIVRKVTEVTEPEYPAEDPQAAKTRALQDLETGALCDWDYAEPPEETLISVMPVDPENPGGPKEPA